MKDIIIIANPSSGRKQAKYYAEKAEAFFLEHKRKVDIKYTSKKSDISTFAKRASDERYHTIIVMGGDGTVTELINGLKNQEHKPIVGIIPSGTVNNIARSLGFSPDPEEAIKQFVDSEEKEIDAGRINSQLFLSSASAGSIPETVWEVSDEQKSRYGPAAYFFTGLQSLRDDGFYRMRMELDGEVAQVDLSLLLVGVSHSIIGIPNFFDNARYDDGKLHLFGLKKTTIGEKISVLPSLFFSGERFNESQDYAFTTSFKKAVISVDNNSTYLAVDGERGPKFPVEIEVLPRYFTFLVYKS